MPESFLGFRNKQTWAVNLWLTNDPQLYAGLQDILSSGVSIYEKATRLREFVEDMIIPESPSLASELVIQALGEVDWQEIIAANEE